MKVPAESAPTYNELMRAKESKGAEKLGEEFEAFFITSMVKDLAKTAHFSKKSFMEDTYTSIMYEKLGEYVAQKKGLGIKDMLVKYMERAGDAKVSGELSDNKDK